MGAAALLLAIAAGCGQKGPLTLPAATPPSTSAAPAAGVPASQAARPAAPSAR